MTDEAEPLAYVEIRSISMELLLDYLSTRPERVSHLVFVSIDYPIREALVSAISPLRPDRFWKAVRLGQVQVERFDGYKPPLPDLTVRAVVTSFICVIQEVTHESASESSNEDGFSRAAALGRRSKVRRLKRPRST